MLYIIIILISLSGIAYAAEGGGYQNEIGRIFYRGIGPVKGDLKRSGLGSFSLKVDDFLDGFEVRNIIGQYGCPDLPCQNGNGDVVIVFGMQRFESP